MRQSYRETFKILRESIDSLNLGKYPLEGNSLRYNSLLKLRAWKKAGYTRYQWLSNKDERVRLNHKSLNGTVYKIEDALANPPLSPFPGDIRVNGQIAPREVFNCRCGMRPIR